jgi:membrane protease YdiL (CAAX protease family)
MLTEKHRLIPRLLRIWAATWRIVSFVIIWGVLVSIVFSISETPSFLSNQPAWLRFYNELVPLTAVIFTTWFATRYLSKKTLQVKYGTSKKSLLVGLLVGCVWIGLSVAIIALINSLSIPSHHPVSSPIVWIVALLLNTMMQELLVRGYIFNLVRANHGLIAATILTTLMFVGLHGPDVGAYGLNILNIISASLVFTGLLAYTEGLTSPIIAHFIWNSVGGIVFGVVVLADDYPSYMHSITTGLPAVSGGSAKIEGSIVVFVINITICLLLFYAIRRKRQILTKHP